MKFFNLFFIILILVQSCDTIAQLTPQTAIGLMKRGINIGNTMENNINGAIQQYYFDDYKAAGFNCIRIPINWGNHTSSSLPYAIDAAWLNTVEQVIDWGLQRDLFIIINAHHEDWLKQNYTNPAYRARFDSIWRQISTRFKNKSEKLLFEMINEPFGMTTAQVNDLNFRILPIIRQSNPTRIVIYSGKDYTGLQYLMEAAIPSDNYLMGYFHSYDPWNFAGLGVGTWSQTDINSCKSMFAQAGQWSTAHNIPVMISEFGAVKNCDYNSRMLFYSTYVEEAYKNNVAFQVWDDAGDFGIYLRSTRAWPEIKDILVKAHPNGPTSLSAVKTSDSLVTLTWVNRTTANSSIRIERKTNGGNFIQVAQLPANATIYTDNNLTGGNSYYYHVISYISASESYYSYPFKIYFPPTERTNYQGIPFNVPGLIEAEDFDIGGEGLTYHDTDEGNTPGAYRPYESVDIEARTSGGYHISYTATGEWIEYTISVPQAHYYTIKTYTASLAGGGRIQFSSNGHYSPIVIVPSTNSWQTTTLVQTSVYLDAGQQILRLSIVESKPFNIDRMLVDFDTTTSVQKENLLQGEFSLGQNFPNPFNPSTIIKYSIKNSTHVLFKVYNTLGQEVSTLINEEKQAGSYEVNFDASKLNSGVYFYTLCAGSFVETKKLILVK